MKKIWIVCLVMIFGNYFLYAQEEENNDSEDNPETQVEVKNPEFALSTTKVKDSIYMLSGKGGNVGVYVGQEGVLVIDSQFEESAPKIMNIVSRLSNKGIQLLINTHHHGDHTGGNEFMHNNNVLTMAQKNVRELMVKSENKKIQDQLDAAYEEAYSQAIDRGADEQEATAKAKNAVKRLMDEQPSIPTLPKLVFENEIEMFYDRQEIKVFHLHNAHTSGDAVVYFMSSNVIHTGDTYVNGKYPFVDIENGGTYDGYLKGLKKLLMMMNDATIIIPGHGPLATKKDVQETESLMRYIIPKIQYHVIAGKSLQEVLNLNETKTFDAKGFGNGFISTEKFITSLYNSFKERYNKEKTLKEK